jgi:integrase/recombinase XerD
MSPLREHLADYLAMRRALGYKLARSEKLLAQFVTYLEAIGASTITIDDAVAWATLPAGSQVWWAMRLSVVRGFAGYVHTLDDCCEVPPSDLFRRRPRSRVPYLYSDPELDALLAATATIASPFRAATIRTLIGLLAVTGMRVGEAIAADRDDLDLDTGVLFVRHGKYGKTRQLPLRDSTLEAIAAYLERPDRPQRPGCPALLVSTVGTRLYYPDVCRTFTRLVAHAGLRARSPRCSPRIHDLRHTFAVQTLLDCYQAGIDVDTRLPLLSTYLGHVNPASTYWYLTGSSELLALAGQRLQSSLGETA